MIDYNRYPPEWKTRIDRICRYLCNYERQFGSFQYFQIVEDGTTDDGLHFESYRIADLALSHKVQELLILLPPLCEYIRSRCIALDPTDQGLLNRFTDELFCVNPLALERHQAIELCRKFEGVLRALSYVVFRGKTFEWNGEQFDSYAGGTDCHGNHVDSFKSLSLSSLLTGKLQGGSWRSSRQGGPVLVADGLVGLYPSHCQADHSLPSNTLLYHLTDVVKLFRNEASHEDVPEWDLYNQLREAGQAQVEEIMAPMIYNQVILLLLAVLDYRYDTYLRCAESENGRYLPYDADAMTAEARIERGMSVIKEHYFAYLSSYVTIEARKAFLGRANDEKEVNLLDQLINTEVCLSRFDRGTRIPDETVCNPHDVVIENGRENRLCMFVGASGTGKSTLLIQLLGSAIKLNQSRSADDMLVPVRLSLSSVNETETSLAELLRRAFLEAISAEIIQSEREFVQLAYDELYRQKRLLFMLDALDEVPSGARSRKGVNVRQWLAEEIIRLAGLGEQGHQIVLTTRYDETRREVDETLCYANRSWKVYFMHPLSNAQKLELINRCHDLFQTSEINWEELRRRIASNVILSRYADSPMHLMIIISILTQEDDPSMLEHIRTGILYRLFTRQLYRKNSVRLEELNVLDEDFESLLIEVAEFTWAKRNGEWMKEEIYDYLVNRHILGGDRNKIVEAISIAVGMNILQSTAHRLDFVHTSFKRFYLALFIVRLLHSKRSDPQTLRYMINQLADDESMGEMLRVVLELLYEEEGENPGEPRLSTEVAGLILDGGLESEVDENDEPFSIEVQEGRLSVQAPHVYKWRESLRLRLLCEICSDLPTSRELGGAATFPTASDLVVDVLCLQLGIIARQAMNGLRNCVRADAVSFLFSFIAQFGKEEVLDLLMRPELLGIWLFEQEEIDSVTQGDNPFSRSKKLRELKKNKQLLRDGAKGRLQFHLAYEFHQPKVLLRRLVSLHALLEKNSFTFAIDNIRKMYTWIFCGMNDIDRQLLYEELSDNAFLRGQLIFFIEDIDFLKAHFGENMRCIDITPNMLKSFQLRILDKREMVDFFCDQCSEWADFLYEKIKNQDNHYGHKDMFPAIAMHTWLIKGVRNEKIIQFVSQHIDYLKLIGYLYRLIDLVDLQDVDPELIRQLYEPRTCSYALSLLHHHSPTNSIPYFIYNFAEREFAIPAIAEPLAGRYVGVQYVVRGYCPERWARVESVRSASLSLVRLEIKAESEGVRLPPLGKLCGETEEGQMAECTVYRISPHPCEMPYYSFENQGMLQRWADLKSVVTFSGIPCRISRVKSPKAFIASDALIIKVSGLTAKGMLAQGYCQFYKGPNTLQPLQVDKSIHVEQRKRKELFRPLAVSPAGDGLVQQVYYSVFENTGRNGLLTLLTEPLSLTTEMQICLLPRYINKKLSFVSAIVRRRRSLSIPRYAKLKIWNDEGILINRTESVLQIRRSDSGEVRTIPYSFMMGSRQQFEFRISDQAWVNYFADNAEVIKDLRENGGLYIEDFPMKLQGVEIVELNESLTLLEVQLIDPDTVYMPEGYLQFKRAEKGAKVLPVELRHGVKLGKSDPQVIYLGDQEGHPSVMVRSGLSDARGLWYRTGSDEDYKKILSCRRESADGETAMICALEEPVDSPIGERIRSFEFAYHFPVQSRIFDFLYQPFVLPRMGKEAEGMTSLIGAIDLNRPECYHRDVVNLWINNLRAKQEFDELYLPLARMHSCMAEMLKYIFTLPEDVRWRALQSPHLVIQPYIVKSISSTGILLQNVMLQDGKNEMNLYEYSPDQLQVGDIVLVEENRTVRLLPKHLRHPKLGYHHGCMVFENRNGIMSVACRGFKSNLLLAKEDIDRLDLKAGQKVSCLAIYDGERQVKGFYACDIRVETYYYKKTTSNER